MTSIRESRYWRFGDEGQRFIADWLRRRGCWVIHSYDYAGPDGTKVPRMFGSRFNLILPDLDVSKGGRRFWVEVKTKRHPTLHRKSQVWEHGFAKRHFDDYLHVSRITGTDVFVIFYETESGRLRGQWLSILADPEHPEYHRVNLSEQMGQMVFFPVDLLKQIDLVDTEHNATPLLSGLTD